MTTSEHLSQVHTADDDTTSQQTTEEASRSSTVDPRVRYTQQLQQLSDFAIQQGEFYAYFESSIRELAWVAVSNNHSTEVLGEILQKLSWYVLEQTRHLEAQRELKKAKAEGCPIH